MPCRQPKLSAGEWTLLYPCYVSFGPMRRLFSALLLLVCFASALPAQVDGAARSYRIGPRDQVQIRVEELSDLDSDVTVADDGTIELPIIGPLAASGMTEDELALRLRGRLQSEGLRRATVSVKVTAYRSRPVSVLGAVEDPGNHFVPGRASLMEILLNAGGLSTDNGGEIYIRRQAENGLTDQVRISARALIEEGDPDVNIPIFAGDTINVPMAREVTIHFLGEVANAGSLTFRSNQRVTLLTALARAGGLLETAAKKIRIIRQREASRSETTVDYRQILSGETPDPLLEDGDLIVVKESFF